MEKRLIKYLEKVNRKLEQGEHVSVEFKFTDGTFHLPLRAIKFRNGLITLDGQTYYYDIDDDYEFDFDDLECQEPKLYGKNDIKIGFRQEHKYILEHE